MERQFPRRYGECPGCLSRHQRSGIASMSPAGVTRLRPGIISCSCSGSIDTRCLIQRSKPQGGSAPRFPSTVSGSHCAITSRRAGRSRPP